MLEGKKGSNRLTPSRWNRRHAKKTRKAFAHSVNFISYIVIFPLSPWRWCDLVWSHFFFFFFLIWPVQEDSTTNDRCIFGVRHIFFDKNVRSSSRSIHVRQSNLNIYYMGHLLRINLAKQNVVGARQLFFFPRQTPDTINLAFFSLIRSPRRVVCYWYHVQFFRLANKKTVDDFITKKLLVCPSGKLIYNAWRIIDFGGLWEIEYMKLFDRSS
jgi:hypothetical protein